MIRRVLGPLRKLILLLAVLMVGLSLLYIVVTPPSTLILGRWLSLKSVERHVVPIEEISPNLRLMVIASEDGQFCRHNGIDWDQVRIVIETGARRGASTIPMQAAKNVFLWPQRSYVRKALEVPLAMWLDLIWSKRRMLEIYLNVVEWDEGVFGAEAAARHYFDKSASALTQREAALLATALPSPLTRNPGRPSANHARLAERLAARAAQSGPIAACVD
ncbi:MAG TPA: monofunctional biosynthetic peptidoglycan transglycosylase [Saliniramus sp.]|nr:monofunctional biosynthetic peptidoglycan transglycosylase [Saliniramus sp.]